MFGALSGNVDVVRTLLDAGAKTLPVNKVSGGMKALEICDMMSTK